MSNPHHDYQIKIDLENDTNPRWTHRKLNDNYQGKVDYYHGKLSDALQAQDIEQSIFFQKKLNYFLTRQKQSLSK